jgi:hypothetical protein
MTVANLYKKHKEGSISKEKFLYEVRRDAQLPFISNLTSYEDAIKILKQKGMIKETYDFDLTQHEIPNLSAEQIGTLQTLVNLLHKDQNWWNSQYPDNSGNASRVIDDISAVVRDLPDFLKRYQNDNPIPVVNFLKKQISSRYSYGLNESKKIIKEQTDLHLQIDRLNPVLVKKAVNSELAKLPMIDAQAYQKTTEKVVKKLQKDPRAYDEVLVTNAKEIYKADEKLKMTQVKSELKDPHNQMKSPKGLEKPKTNVKASKKENKKGKPKGVKEMKGSKKGNAGVKQMENPGTKETVLESLLSFMFKKKLNEDTHYEYGVGHGVQVPEGRGVIEGLVGDTATVVFEDGSKKDYQINALRYHAENAKKQVEEETPEVKKHEPTMDEKKEAVLKKVMEFLKKKKVKEAVTAKTTDASHNQDVYNKINKIPGQARTDIKKAYDSGKTIDI